MRTVGVLGGGQLGMMLAERLVAREARVRVFDPDPLAPAVARFPDGAVVAPWSDLAAVERFANGCDVVTCEFENVPETTARTAARFAELRPEARVLAVAQHRVREKEFLTKEGLPHAGWWPVARAEDLVAAAEAAGAPYPLVAKTAFGGYDGKGQRSVADRAALESYAADARAGGFGDAGFVLEERIELAGEVSCIVARGARGEEVAFPIFENLHERHILDFTLVPARVSPAVAAAAQRVALATARALGVVGLLTVELFLTHRAPRAGAADPPVDGLHVLVNELAPRPHNSGHVTRVACEPSQFEALARVLLDLPLDTPRPAEPGAFCMGNLLGDLWRDGAPPPGLAAARPGDGGLREVVLYGKPDARPRRKMGHFVVQGPTPDAALARARALRDAWTRS